MRRLNNVQLPKSNEPSNEMLKYACKWERANYKLKQTTFRNVDWLLFIRFMF